MLTCAIAIWTFLLHIDLCKAAETILFFCRKPQAWVKHQKRIEITRACVLLPEAPAVLWERKYRGRQLLGLPSAVRPGGCCGIPPTLLPRTSLAHEARCSGWTSLGKVHTAFNGLLDSPSGTSLDGP